MTSDTSLKRQRSSSSHITQPITPLHPASTSDLHDAAPSSETNLKLINPERLSPKPDGHIASEPSDSSSPDSYTHLSFHGSQPTSASPLTRANLNLFSQGLAPSLCHQSPSDSEAETMPPKSSSSSAIDPTTVWKNLNRNHIYNELPRGRALGQNLINKANGIINNFRKSAMTEGEQEEVMQAIKTNKFKNETTMIIEVWQVLLNKSRTKRPDLEDEEWILTAWKKDGLARAWQLQFNAKAIPQLDPDGPEWQEWQNIPRVTTPYPDILYGYEDFALPQAVLEVLQDLEIALVKAMHLPWFSVDAKGVLKPIEEAETQCARAGVSMVQHLLDFFAFIMQQIAAADKQHAAKGSNPTFPNAATTGQPTITTPFTPYVDEFAIAFTLALVPSKAHLFVHFAERHTATQTHYHMHDLGSYDFKKVDDLSLLRKHINNILDWGLRERVQELETQCESLIDSVHQAKKRKLDEAEKDKEAKKGKEAKK